MDIAISEPIRPDPHPYSPSSSTALISSSELCRRGCLQRGLHLRGRLREMMSNGSWRSIWNMEFKGDLQIVKVRGKLQVGAHYFEEGNVQLDAKHECQDSTIFQPPRGCAVSLTNIIRHHETEYLNSLQMSYLNLPDTTFKDLRRKLPVTRMLFPWHNTLQFSLTRDIQKNLGLENRK
ncbi:hypothetical protein OROMI_026277 [Orobanche minor]